MNQEEEKIIEEEIAAFVKFVTPAGMTATPLIEERLRHLLAFHRAFIEREILKLVARDLPRERPTKKTFKKGGVRLDGTYNQCLRHVTDLLVSLSPQAPEKKDLPNSN